jgi:hypothetical protein
MQPFINLEDGTLIVCAAVGAVTSTNQTRKGDGGEQQVRTTRVLSTSAAVLYELVTVIDVNHKESISIAAQSHRSIKDAVAAGLA